jgi:hypothetical protein
MRLPVRRAREPLVVVGHEAALNERARADADTVRLVGTSRGLPKIGEAAD